MCCTDLQIDRDGECERVVRDRAHSSVVPYCSMMSIRSRWLWCALGAFIFTAASSGSAQALMRCSLVTASGVSFGDYDAYKLKPVESTGTITFQCFDVGADDMLSIQLSREIGRAHV